jgi:DNA polymerase III subunit delta'
MSETGVPWPEALAGTPAVSVIEKAVGRRRLSHSLLLSGEDPETLGYGALALADRILRLDAAGLPSYPPDKHPDCYGVRPAGRSRTITAEAIRDLVSYLNVSPSVGRHKVAILYDADRMNAAASNILLKTLEEPPSHATILLLSGRPHALLPTIRSRVLIFRFSGLTPEVDAPGWAPWVESYRAWLRGLSAGIDGAKGASDAVMAAYGLLARFGAILESAAKAELTRRKPLLPEDLDKDELEAVQAEITVGLKLRMFAAIEESTSAHYRELLTGSKPVTERQIAESVGALERAASLLRLNLNESTALEDFLLASLRSWSRR